MLRKQLFTIGPPGERKLAKQLLLGPETDGTSMKFNQWKQVRPRGAAGRRLALAAVAMVGVSTVFAGGLATATAAKKPVDGEPVVVSRIVLGVGAKENQRVLSWYASTNAGTLVQVVPASQLKKGE